MFVFLFENTFHVAGFVFYSTKEVYPVKDMLQNPNNSNV